MHMLPGESGGRDEGLDDKTDEIINIIVLI